MKQTSSHHWAESLPISLMAHWQFCPRRAWLEAMGERMAQSSQMAVGTDSHRKVDKPTTTDAATVRAVDVVSVKNGFHGRIDRAELLDGKRVRIIEHKATPVKLTPEVTDANRVQLALQAIALEEMGFQIAETEVYFSTHHRRIGVDLNEQDRIEALAVVKKTRAVVDAPSAPEPLLNDSRCFRCSHAAVCLPEERQEAEVSRKIIAPDPAADVVHLTTPGSRASITSRRMVINKNNDQLASIPMERILAVVVHGNVDLSGALIRDLMWRDLPIVWCTGYGRVVGWSRSAQSPNGAARLEQFRNSIDGRLDLAQQFISCKINNQATILRRFGGPKATVSLLRGLARQSTQCTSISALLGIEGQASNKYFQNFTTLLIDSVGPEVSRLFPGRVGRGATDPLNVALNYAYGMLLGEVIRSIIGCGLDPSVGFIHSSGRNKPALALDLMEEFRAPLADAVILGAFNNGELNTSSFTSVLGSHRLTDTGRKKIIKAFERRMTTEITHPVFRYRATWRRILEIQSRMVLGVIDGTQPHYRGVTVR